MRTARGEGRVKSLAVLGNAQDQMVLAGICRLKVDHKLGIAPDFDSAQYACRIHQALRYLHFHPVVSRPQAIRQSIGPQALIARGYPGLRPICGRYASAVADRLRAAGKANAQNDGRKRWPRHGGSLVRLPIGEARDCHEPTASTRCIPLPYIAGRVETETDSAPPCRNQT